MPIDCTCLQHICLSVVNITFTPELLDKLRNTYNQAVADNQNEFVFEGHPFVTGYAKYLIEHLENVFGTTPPTSP